MDCSTSLKGYQLAKQINATRVADSLIKHAFFGVKAKGGRVAAKKGPVLKPQKGDMDPQTGSQRLRVQGSWIPRNQRGIFVPLKCWMLYGGINQMKGLKSK